MGYKRWLRTGYRYPASPIERVSVLQAQYANAIDAVSILLG